VFAIETVVGVFRFIPLGIGDTFSSRFYTSSVLLQCDGANVLIDCPDVCRKVLREAGAPDLPEIHDLLLTHLHGDHANGLEGVGFWKHFVEKRRMRLHAAPEVLAELWEHKLKAAMRQLCSPDFRETREMRFEDYFEPFPIRGAHSVGPFEVEARLTKHHIPCTGFRIRAGGRSLGFSGDTAFDPEHLAWLGDCDLILHEVNLGVHTAYEKLLTLPADLKAKVRLYHVSDLFDIGASQIAVLEQGRPYSV
jgi:ribonuclease BN (tRNA processing enzyme)